MKLKIELAIKSSLYWMIQATIFALTLIFVYAGSVQFNDPDPIFWSAMYGGAVLISLLDWSGVVRNRILCAIMGVFYALIFVFWLFRFWPWNVEEQRELGGLFLLISWAALSYYKHRSSSLIIQTG